MTIRVKNSALRTFQKVLPFSKKSWKKFLECAGRWKNVQESVEAEIVEKAEMNPDPGLSVTPACPVHAHTCGRHRAVKGRPNTPDNWLFKLAFICLWGKYSSFKRFGIHSHRSMHKLIVGRSYLSPFLKINSRTCSLFISNN